MEGTPESEKKKSPAIGARKGITGAYFVVTKKVAEMRREESTLQTPKPKRRRGKGEKRFEGEDGP